MLVTTHNVKIVKSYLLFIWNIHLFDLFAISPYLAGKSTLNTEFSLLCVCTHFQIQNWNYAVQYNRQLRLWDCRKTSCFTKIICFASTILLFLVGSKKKQSVQKSTLMNRSKIWWFEFKFKCHPFGIVKSFRGIPFFSLHRFKNSKLSLLILAWWDPTYIHMYMRTLCI